MKNPEKPVSVLQAAKVVSRSHTAIQNAINAGRLVSCVVRNKTGKPKILLSKFKAEWESFTDPVASMEGSKGGRPSKQQKAAEPALPPVRRIAPAFREEIPDHTPPGEVRSRILMDENGQAIMDLRASSTLESYYKAQMAELRFKEKAGELVIAKEVQEAAFKVGRQLRDAMLSIPERLSSRLAAENDPHKVHRLLLDEITKNLISLRDAAPADAG